jgi:hypothetical protein
VGEETEYEKPMKEFLNRAMKHHDSGTTKKAANFFTVFPKVTESIVAALGERPFHLRGPLNVSALDSVMSVLIGNYRKLESIDLKKKYAKLRNDDEFDEYTRINTTDTKTVLDRIAKVEEYLLP